METVGIDPLVEFISSKPKPPDKELKRAYVVLLVKMNKSYREIQQGFGVSLGFISKWNQAYQSQGVAGLKLKYWGTLGYLTPQQKQAVIEWLKYHKRWNLDELVTHIKQSYGVVYQSKQSYYDLFHQAEVIRKKS